MDAEYGRLWTTADLYAVADALVCQFPPDAAAPLLRERVDAILATTRPTFPADEPLFLLRATDRAALETLAFYRHESNRYMGIGETKHDERVLAAFDAMHAWQVAHPESVKGPTDG